LNATDEPALRALLADFCAAPEWLDRLTTDRPFSSAAALQSASEDAAEGVSPGGWREAFRHHPRIGERQAERLQSASAQAQSSREQGAVEHASAADRAALAEGNRVYEARFGQPFIVCASGRPASEMLALLRERLNNDPDTELRVAAGEQRKITKLRLSRLLE
jgi:2-oxo-4-hydroxy-4-carboxy-5-ureidoimidazoline decarboxylase